MVFVWVCFFTFSSGFSKTCSLDEQVMIVTEGKCINDRESKLLEGTQEIQTAGATQTATKHVSTADVSGDLRIVVAKALALSQHINKDLPETAWQIEGMVWDLDDPENLTTKDGRLWAKLQLRDASGELVLYATQAALLGMTNLSTKEEFLQCVESNSLERCRIVGRVHRSVQEQHINVNLIEAAPMFLVPLETGALEKLVIKELENLLHTEMMQIIKRPFCLMLRDCKM